jgi:hypothetical protein
VYPRTPAVPQKVRSCIDFLNDWFAVRNVNRAGLRP